MKRIFMYGHGGSENHGCEAIVRSTIQLLENNEFFLISSNPDEDRKYGLDQLCELIPEKNAIHKNSFDFIKALVNLKLKKDYVSMDKLLYKDAFKRMEPGDIALSIGGDNYCYADVNRYIMMHELAKKQGAKTILWGCSVEPDLLKEIRIASDLQNYDYIFARESISYEALKKVNKNTIFMPDTAFLLEKEICLLLEGFIPGKTVGINVSPMVINNENKPGIVIENFINVINYIIEETDYNIALIPHVVWEDSNDLLPLNNLYKRFEDTGRIILIENQSCCKLKYLISQCCLFIGARTHSTIAAYSSGIPTIVVGYSVKSAGIARDIFGNDENYIVSSSSLDRRTILLEKFKLLLKNKDFVEDKLRIYNSTLFSKYDVISEL